MPALLLALLALVALGSRRRTAGGKAAGTALDGLEDAVRGLLGEDVSRPATPDLGTLAPTFRDRLAALMGALDAMGFAPVVYEAQRSQGRQDWLYEQGRTRPGEIVTWTHNSKHIDGLAADIVDGRKAPDGAIYAWGFPAGETAPGEFFKTMATLAPTFGLRSLGPDQGDWSHVEAV